MKGESYNTPFSILHSISLLSQRQRLQKFAKAIKEYVRPGSFVIDIGTGTGVLALLAAKAGAEFVIGIDSARENVIYAEQVAKVNNLDENVRFIHSHFEDFFWEKRADVIICEMLSSMLLVEQQVPAMIHAKENLLTRNGTMIPKSTKVYAVPVQARTVQNRFQFQDIAFPRRPQSVHALGEVDDLADMQLLFAIDYERITEGFRVSKQLSFKILEDGYLSGILGMFETELAQGIVVRAEDGWKHLFIPFEQERKVVKGQEVIINIDYTPGELDSISISLSI